MRFAQIILFPIFRNWGFEGLLHTHNRRVLCNIYALLYHATMYRYTAHHTVLWLQLMMPNISQSFADAERSLQWLAQWKLMHEFHRPFSRIREWPMAIYMFTSMVTASCRLSNIIRIFVVINIPAASSHVYNPFRNLSLYNCSTVLDSWTAIWGGG